MRWITCSSRSYDRLHEAVRRARGKMSERDRDRPAEQARLLALLEELQPKAQSWNRVVVREAGRMTFLKPDEIDWIEAEGNYLQLHAGSKAYLLRETMNAAEERLAAKKFLRVSRSTLVNLGRIQEWQPLFHGDPCSSSKTAPASCHPRVSRKVRSPGRPTG
jgi:two-component system LytT family response regulator